MGKLTKKFLYRIFCIIALSIAIYLIVDLNVSRTLNIKMMIVFLLFVIVTVWGIVDRKKDYAVIEKQEAEILMYQLYIAPLEELVKEIRAKQHEFDNHKNAILNMHITIDNYEELVQKQSEYVREVAKDGGNQYMPLLRISDKVLAGFLYSKIVRSKEYVTTEVEVKALEIISKVSEHSLIEVVGVLVDNAYEACTKACAHVMISLDSKNDKLIFEIKNQSSKQSIQDIGRFFEKGYSQKSQDSKRGLGLYRAKLLVEKHRGEITVGQEMQNGVNYIHFKVVL